MDGFFDVFREILIPAFTGVAGWFASVWRTKQRKEADILDNMKQILEMQKEYIQEQDKENKKTRELNARLEKRLDQKRESIRKANKCKYTNEDDGCPVLIHEDLLDEKCSNCKLKEHADCSD